MNLLEVTKIHYEIFQIALYPVRWRPTYLTYNLRNWHEALRLWG